MVFFTYIFFYILKTTRKYGKNLPGMCGKKLFPGAKYDSRFSWEKMSDCQNFIPSKILCYIFWVYAVDYEVKQKSKMKNVKEKKNFKSFREDFDWFSVAISANQNRDSGL